MIFEASEFVFKAPPVLSRVRRVLIKPSACYPVSYPVTTSRDILSVIIEGIRRVTDADILLLEGTPGGSPIYPIYQALGYNFPRVLTLDIKDCIWVEVDNPLPKPLAVPTFWVPNVILSSDYLITMAPLKVFNGMGSLSLMNLLTVLPSSKYGGEAAGGWGALYSLGIDRVIALVKPKRLYVFNTCKGIIDEFGTYARKLDNDGQPTDKIKDKETFHRLDALRYIVQRFGVPSGAALIDFA